MILPRGDAARFVATVGRHGGEEATRTVRLTAEDRKALTRSSP